MEEREKFYVEQRIKLNTEILRVLHLTLLATLGGTLTLILTRTEEKRYVLVFFGISIICAISIIIVLLNSEKLIEKLKKK
jgi:bacteriorhodopsin